MIHDKLTHFKLMLLICTLCTFTNVHTRQFNTPGTLNSAVKCKDIENIIFHRHPSWTLSIEQV